VLPFGPNNVKTIAVCSGGGSYSGFYQALDAGVDLYITGDAVEIYHTAKDARINVIFAGHHATETLGLKALSRVLQKKFGIETTYIDLPTGL
jgi:putative NIF3 family GTP cyclohydrolase 1 type 2